MVVGTGHALMDIDLDPEAWKATACRLAARTITRDEWDRFLAPLPYQPACAAT